MTIPYYERTADLSAGELVDLIYSLSHQLEEKFSVSDENREILSTFRAKVVMLIPFAERNDFQNIPANGFRSSLRGICHMFYAVVERMSEPRDVQDFFTALNILDKWIDNSEDMEKNGDPIRYPPWNRKLGRRLLQDGIDDGLKCLSLFLSEPMVGMSYTNGLRFVQKMTIRFSSMFTASSFMESLSLLFSYEKAVDSTTSYIQQHISEDTLHNIMTKTSYLVTSFLYQKIFGRVLRTLHNFKIVTNVDTKEVIENIPSPVEIVVLPETGSVELRKRSQDVKFRHRYIIVRSKGEQFKGKVIFFVHGGGFVLTSADFYNDVFLSRLADAMPGITIINVDISSSVHGRFPKIPQEVLDLYFRFFSQQVKNRPDMLPYPLDFDVKEVALLGESSGGNLITSLIFQLNDWRTKVGDHFDILMPRSIVPLYPKMFARPQADAGLLINSWSCMMFLNAYTLKAIMETYCPFRRRDKNGNWSLLPNGERPPKEWMWMEDEIDIIDHPYISPGSYEDFGSLKDIELHILGLNFDGFIHEAVSFARMWKGDVNLVTIDGVPHGFNLLPVYPIYDKSMRDARDQITKLIKDSLS